MMSAVSRVAGTTNLTRTSKATRGLQRKCNCHATGEECERCSLQRKCQGMARADERGAVPEIVDAVVRSSGEPLDAGTRQFMESRFNYDFSRVRAHTDRRARQSAESVDAQAYTVGQHVVFGTGGPDISSPDGKRLLAHELAHVVQQSRGGTPLGVDGDPALERDADRAAEQALVGGRPGQPNFDRDSTGNAISNSVVSVAHRSGIGIARQAKAHGVPPSVVMETRYKVILPEGEQLLTAAEYEHYRQQAISRLRADIKRVTSLAEVGRDSQVDMLKDYQGGVESLSDVWNKKKALIGIAADIWANTTPPSINAWNWPKKRAASASQALDRGDLAQAAQLMTLAERDYKDALKDWNTYREQTISGAEKLQSDLETTRDVSFAIALAAAAAVAAPVVATVAGAGVVGTGLTALGTAAVTGAGGVALGAGSEALGSYASTGKVDLKASWQAGKRYGKEGVITGLTGGLGKALEGVGLASKLGFVQQAVRRCAVDAGVNLSGQLTTEALDSLTAEQPLSATLDTGNNAAGADAPKPILSPKARAILTGCLSGALGVPISKLPGGQKAANVAVAGGVGYLDARLEGKHGNEAASQALQGAGTALLIGGATHKQLPHAAAAHETAPPTTAHGLPPKPETAVSTAHTTHVPNAPSVSVPHHEPGSTAGAESKVTASAVAHSRDAATTPEPISAAFHEPTRPAKLAAPPAAKPPTEHAAEAGSQGREKSAPARSGVEHDDAAHKATGKRPPAHQDDVAPAVLKEKATATSPAGEGHEAVVTEQGVARCSPTPCPVIHVEYQKELAENAVFREWNKRIQGMRKTQPELAAKEAADLIKILDEERASGGTVSEDAMIDRKFDNATTPDLVKRGDRFYISASAEHASGEVPVRYKPRLREPEVAPGMTHGSNVQEGESHSVKGKKSAKSSNEPRDPTLDIQDLVPTKKELTDESTRKAPRAAAAKRAKTVLGRSIDDHPLLRDMWNECASRVQGDTPLTPENKTKLYDRTRDEFWKTVRAQDKRGRQARGIFWRAGFEFPKAGNAPLLKVADASKFSNNNQRRVSLDHVSEKSDFHEHALDPKNLRFELQVSNSEREALQKRHTELMPDDRFARREALGKKTREAPRWFGNKSPAKAANGAPIDDSKGELDTDTDVDSDEDRP